jgi:hypothetical protein
MKGKKVEDEGGEFGTAGCHGLLCSVSVPSVRPNAPVHGVDAQGVMLCGA